MALVNARVVALLLESMPAIWLSIQLMAPALVIRVELPPTCVARKTRCNIFFFVGCPNVGELYSERTRSKTFARR